MPHFSNPNQHGSSIPPTPQGIDSEAQLKAGLMALDQSYFTEAIAYLEAAYQSADRRSVRLKAQMALVKAYERAGEFEQALVRCEVLLNSPSHSVQQWAQQAMNVLEKRHGDRFEGMEMADADDEGHGLTSEPDEHQQSLAQSPFTTEASTLVDHPFPTEEGALEGREADNALDNGDRPPEHTQNNAPTHGEREDGQLGGVQFEEAPFEEAPFEEAPFEEASFEEAPFGEANLEDTGRTEADAIKPEPSLPASQSTNPTGFLPFHEDNNSFSSSSAHRRNSFSRRSTDPTGFAPLEPTMNRESQDAADLTLHESNGASILDDPSQVSQGSQEEKVGDNPFSFDELADSSDAHSNEQIDNSYQLTDRHSADATPPENPPANDSFTATTHSLLSAHPPHGRPRPASSPQEAEVPASPTSAAHPHSAKSKTVNVAPELAAALNISKPRSSRRNSTVPPAGTPPVNSSVERAKQWTPLKPSRQVSFWLSYGWTAIALVALLSILTQVALETALPVWRRIGRMVTVPRWYFLETHTTWVIIIALVIMFMLSQWLLRFILGRFYRVKPLPERELERRSPETLRIMKRVCKQGGFPLPKLSLQPSSAPFILSYGLLPRTSCIVVSQGLLTQLKDDEIAALYGAELGHIRQRDSLPLMLVVVVAQIPFLIYRASAAWGDRRRNPLFRGVAAAVSSIAYSFFWMFRWPGLWLSRTRQFQGDRHAVSITGNPNGLASALTAVATGMAQDIERQRSTDFMISSLEMLMPLSPQQSLPLGSVYAHAHHTPHDLSANSTAVGDAVTFPSLLGWDTHNPHRHGLLINNSHPLLGDRIKVLSQCARQLRIHSAMSLPPRSALPTPAKSAPFWIQAAPYLGAPVGIALAIALWLVGGIARLANFNELDWLWKDMSLLVGFMAIGFSFGTLLRLNQFFPDIRSPDAQTEAMLPTLLQTPTTIPLDSIPVQLEGRLIGRSGISNGMGQDLMLRTRTGTLKLHWVSAIGPFGNLILGKNRPATLIGRPVTVAGWFRRGSTPWIDAEKIRVEGRTLAQSSHPLWSTLLAIAAALWGAFVIYQGSL